MTLDEVKTLKKGDQLSYVAPNGEHYRCVVEMALDRLVRVDWTSAPRGYDVLEKQSPIWLHMTHRKMV